MFCTQKIGVFSLFCSLFLGSLLAGCNEPVPVASRAMNAPIDALVTSFCSITCSNNGILSEEIISYEQCLEDDPCLESGDAQSLQFFSIGVIANQGNAQIQRLNLNRAQPRFFDANSGIPGVTGILVASGPIALAHHQEPSLVWVASTGSNPYSAGESTSPQITIIDVAQEGTNLFPEGFPLVGIPSDLASIPATKQAAYIVSDEQLLVVVEDQRERGRGITEINRIPLDGIPEHLVIDEDQRAYVSYKNQSYIDVFNLENSCHGRACHILSLETSEPTSLGEITIVSAIEQPHVPALLLVSDLSEGQLLIFDTITGEQINVNALNNMRDQEGVVVSSEIISALDSRISESTTEFSVLNTMDLTLTTTTRSAIVTTTSGVGYAFILDQAMIVKHDEEIVYSRYLPLLRPLDANNTNASIDNITCSLPRSMASINNCNDPRLPSLRPVDCSSFDEVETIDYNTVSGDAFIGICNTENTCLSEQPAGSCCLQGECQEAQTRNDCANSGGVYSTNSCDSSWCSTTAYVDQGFCCYEDQPCIENVSQSVCTFNNGDFCSELNDDNRCPVITHNASCELEPVIFAETNSLELIEVPVDFNVASDNWNITWEGTLPETTRSDAILSMEGSEYWIQFGNMGECSSQTCETVHELECDFVENLCDQGVDICSQEYDLCTICPELCENETLCELGVETNNDLLLITPLDEENEYSSACSSFLESNTEELVFEYPIVAVSPTRLLLDPPICPDSSDCTIPSLAELEACFASSPFSVSIVAGQSWILTGDRLGYNSPYIEENGECVLEDDIVSNVRPLEGERFNSRWGFHFTLDSGVETNGELAIPGRDFAIQFSSASNFSSQVFSIAASPSAVTFANTSYGPRFLVTDNGSNHVIVFNANTFNAVDNPIP